MSNSSSARWIGMLLIVVLGILAFYFSGGTATGFEDQADLSLRNSGFPATHIRLIEVDLASPNHWVTLTWSGPQAATQKTGPFRSSPGKGLGNNDCNDVAESNREGSLCTPKGQMVVEGLSDSLPSVSTATYVTWVDMPRAIALHYYPEVPPYPVSSGCIRLEEEAAQLIHNNSVVGTTQVKIGGTWVRPLDRNKLLRQLVSHEGKRWSVYKDSLGYPTIGVGFNLERAGARQAIQAVGADYDRVLNGDQSLSEIQVNRLLERDVDDAIENCRRVFPRFAELSEVRQRVLVDMMFNLGFERFQTFKKMIAAVNDGDFDKAAAEMEDSKWHQQVKSRAIKLEEMMKTGIEDAGPIAATAKPIIDCNMTREEALDGLLMSCPKAIADQQELVDVEYFSFDGELHRGQLLIDRSLVNDIQVVFQIARDCRFPIGTVIPLSHDKFRLDGIWNENQSNEANNAFAFNYRESADLQDQPLHALGRAIDINPVQNPAMDRNSALPRDVAYNPPAAGTLSADHPVVQAFLELGWEWGGFSKDRKDYQHFEKLLKSD